MRSEIVNAILGIFWAFPGINSALTITNFL